MDVTKPIVNHPPMEAFFSAVLRPACACGQPNNPPREICPKCGAKFPDPTEQRVEVDASMITPEMAKLIERDHPTLWERMKNTWATITS